VRSAARCSIPALEIVNQNHSARVQGEAMASMVRPIIPSRSGCNQDVPIEDLEFDLTLSTAGIIAFSWLLPDCQNILLTTAFSAFFQDLVVADKAISNGGPVSAASSWASGHAIRFCARFCALITSAAQLVVAALQCDALTCSCALILATSRFMAKFPGCIVKFVAWAEEVAVAVC